MNLAWLAAVLRPRDVAVHPDFEAPGALTAPAYLAAIVLGEPWRFRRMRDGGPFDGIIESPDAGIRQVQRTLNSETLAQALSELSEELLTGRSDDPARTCALTLMACCAAVERDDYDLCVGMIDAQLLLTARLKDADDRLVQAVLLQQKSLRLRDAGQRYEDASVSSLRLLADLDINDCSSFPLSPSASWNSAETLTEIVAALRDAAYSLFGLEVSGEQWPDLVPSRKERLRARDVKYLLDVDRREARTYSEFVSKLFDQRFRGDDTWSLGEPNIPDLFYSTLALELLGHGYVYQARRDLAQLRFVQSSATRDYSHLDDALRLFRHGASPKELDLALRWLRAGGPLEAVSADARRIIRFRLQRERLRTVELRVLESAAELLAPSEAELALRAVFASLESGAPPNLPGHWQADILKIEAAWRTAAALANSAGRADEVARRLLEETDSVAIEDQPRDIAIARAADNIDWDAVDTDLKDHWKEILADNAERLPATLGVVMPRVGGSGAPSAATGRFDLESIAVQLNIAMRGGEVDQGAIASAVPMVREALAYIRETATKGRYSYGQPTADIAAGLILYVDLTDLWPDLAAFLSDTAVPRLDRSQAFERLARELPAIPADIAQHFQGKATAVLEARDWLTDQVITPYPEALRFFSSHKIISDMQAMELTARLAGMLGNGRQEAARTIATLSRRDPRSWLLAFAIELSHDGDVQVRANAGHCLAQLARSSSEIANISSNRLVGLLREDGLLVPLLVLRGLETWKSDLPEELRSQIATIRSDHPSLAVRRQAERLLTDPVG
jgi:hypothetical protein